MVTFRENQWYVSARITGTFRGEYAEVLGLFGSEDPESAMRERLESKLHDLQDHDNCTAILIEIDL